MNPKWPLIALLSCNLVPNEWQPMEPLEVFSSIHASILECVGGGRSFDRIEWFVADPLINPDTGKPVCGLYDKPNRIILHINTLKEEYGVVVRHELIHAITNGEWNHKNKFVPSEEAWARCEGEAILGLGWLGGERQ